MNPLTAFDSWWETWRLKHPHLALADVTFDQSHTWHALISAIAGLATWLLLGWWLGPRAWAYGVLAAIVVYALRELVARFEACVWIGYEWRGRALFSIPVWWRWLGGRLWDMALDVGKPLWAPGCLALAVLFGQVPPWVVGLFAALSVAIAVAYSVGRPPHALFYNGQY